TSRRWLSGVASTLRPVLVAISNRWASPRCSGNQMWVCQSIRVPPMTGGSSHDERICHRPVGKVEPDGLGARVVKHRVGAAFPPTPAVADPAKWRNGGCDPVGVDPNYAAPQALCHAHAPGHVPAEDTGGEAIGRVVGKRDRALLLVKSENRQDRTE